MDFIIRDLNFARSRIHEFPFVISTVDSKKHIAVPAHEGHHVEYFEDEENLFHDDAPKTHHIQSIVDFVRANEDGFKKEKVLIHCFAGISRSTAVAIGILLTLYPDLTAQDAFERVYKERRQMWPNALVLEFFDAILGRSGEIALADLNFKDKNKNVIV